MVSPVSGCPGFLTSLVDTSPVSVRAADVNAWTARRVSAVSGSLRKSSFQQANALAAYHLRYLQHAIASASSEQLRVLC